MKKLGLVLLALVASALILAAAGCGGGSNDSGNQPGVTTTPLRVNIGDAEEDRILSFEITINSITLASSTGGSTPNLLAGPTEIELTHLAGIVDTLALSEVPPGTYTSATVVVANPEVTVLDNNGVAQEIELPGTATVNVDFNPDVTVGSTPVTLNFDLNLANSVTINFATNPPTVTVNPVFTASAGAGTGDTPETGEIDDLTGSVVSVSGSNVTVAVEHMAENLTFATDSATEFEGFAALSELVAGTVVEIDAVTQGDGSLLATEIELEIEDEDHDAVEVEGLVTSVDAHPASSITMVVHEQTSPTAVHPEVGAEITVDVSEASYEVDDDIDLTGIEAVFDANHVVPGQKVEVEAAEPATDHLAAGSVKLTEQTLRGTAGAVTDLGGGRQQFTLTLDADSAFAVLTGINHVEVIRQASTELHEITAIPLGPVRARGGVFFDGAGFIMSATRIGEPE